MACAKSPEQADFVVYPNKPVVHKNRCGFRGWYGYVRCPNAKPVGDQGTYQTWRKRNNLLPNLRRVIDVSTNLHDANSHKGLTESTYPHSRGRLATRSLFPIGHLGGAEDGAVGRGLHWIPDCQQF